jgi:hypothetical protein
MRWVVGLLIILLSGCQGMSLFERATAEAPLSIMPLWERYQRCLVTTDLAELTLIIDKFELTAPTEVDPPSWIRAWGHHVMSQPIRTAVDPQALGAACTLRVAGLMVEAQHLTEGRALYQHVLARYSSRDLAYYIGQANEALAALQTSAPAVVALRPSSSPSH